MSGRSRLPILALILLLVVVGAGVAMAGGSDDEDAFEPAHYDDAREDEAEGPDRPITGPDLERASEAALDYLGEGRVTDTEVGDEESYYEIEVTRDDGSQVDVQLDESFQVVGTD
jgi:uncharacterized membrane protein YkoI